MQTLYRVENSNTQEKHFTSSKPLFSRNIWSAYEVAPLRKLSTALACQNLQRERVTMTYVVFQNTFNQIIKNPASHLKEESGGSLFITARSRVRSPFLPSHTKLLKDTTHQTDCDIVKKWCILACQLLFHSEHYLSVFTRASTSGMFAFKEMALNSFSSWAFKSRYLFLRTK